MARRHVLRVPLLRRLRRLPAGSAAALRSAMALPRGKPDAAQGVTLALAVLVPLAVGQAQGRLAHGTIAGLAAINAALVDLGGSDRRRLGGVAAAVVLNAGALALGTLVAEPAWLTVVVVVALVPAVSLAGALVPWGPSLAFFATIAFLVGAGLPEAAVGDRLVAALLGGAWALVVAIALVAVGLRPRPGAGMSAAPRGLRLSHALRFGVATGVALALAAGLGLQRGYWLSLTIAFVLRPSLDPTLERTAHRVLGTLGGAALGLLIIEYVADPWALVALVALTLGAAGALLAVHYGAAVVGMTAGILALLDLGHPGSLALVDERIVNTLIGAAVAVLALLLWPRGGATAAAGPRLSRDAAPP